MAVNTAVEQAEKKLIRGGVEMITLGCLHVFCLKRLIDMTAFPDKI